MIAYPTLKQMRDQIARQIGDDSADRATKIDEWINTHYAEQARKHPWPQLLRSSEVEVALSAGASFVYLPKEVETLYFVMAENADAAVNMAYEVILRNATTQFQSAGIVFAYADAGEYGRRCNFHTSEEKIHLATSGTASAAAVVHGTVTSKAPNASSQEIREEVTISPSVGVTTTNTFTEIHSVGVEALSSAIVTVTGNTSGLIYANIGEGEQTARYRRIRLMQPDQVGSYVTVIWKKRPFKLISSNQAVEIPVGPQLVDATTATMMVNQREYNAAALYHQARARDGGDQAFNAAVQQGDKIYLAQPIGQYRGKHIIVVNPG